VRAKVALVFDYASSWAWQTQPQGADFDYFRLCLSAYRALRRAGLSTDILPPDTGDLSQFDLVLAPGLATISDPLMAALERFEGVALIGPRSNAKTGEYFIPVPLPPNLPGLDAVVALSESLPPAITVPVAGGGAVRHWLERLEGSAKVTLTTENGAPLMMQAGAMRYLAGWPDDALWNRIVGQACAEVGLETADLPDGLRLRDSGTHRFVFNYGPETVTFRGQEIAAAGVAWWPRQDV